MRSLSQRYLCRALSKLANPQLTILPNASKIPNDSFYYMENVIEAAEESILVSYLQQKLKNRKYTQMHWDSVITRYLIKYYLINFILQFLNFKTVYRRYREVEMQDDLPVEISAIISNIKRTISSIYGKELVFLPPHVIDLAADGFIGPHVDSIKFSGKIIAGVSLMSTRVMRLKHSLKDATLEPKILGDSPETIYIKLPPRSLYILAESFRFNYTHEILLSMMAGRDNFMETGNDAKIDVSNDSKRTINSMQRISVMFRDVL